jgi:hypothetical protein
MRLHEIGANYTQTTQIVPFDSHKLKADNTGQHLTGKAVSDSIDRVRTKMEGLSEALLCYKGQSESHKEILPLINVMHPYFKLSPHEITGMTESRALALAHRQGSDAANTQS